MKYNTLFSLQLKHGFFLNNNAGRIFRMEPTETCKLLLKRFLLMFQPEASGFRVLFQCEDENKNLPTRVIDESVIFDFNIYCNDPELYSYSELSARRNAKEGFIFTNSRKTGKIDKGYPGLFQEENNSGGKGIAALLETIDKHFSPKLFGIIRMDASSKATSGFNFIGTSQCKKPEKKYEVPGRKYVILIEPGCFFWRYHVETKYSFNHIDALDIKLNNKELNETGAGFIKKTTGKNTLEFVSSMPIKMREQGYKDIMLCRGDIPLIPHLPNPEGKAVSMENGEYYMDIFVYI